MLSKEQIIKNAVAQTKDDDYQVAQNAAYAAALREGYDEETADEIAKDAGLAHADFE